MLWFWPAAIAFACLIVGLILHQWGTKKQHPRAKLAGDVLLVIGFVYGFAFILRWLPAPLLPPQ